MSLKINLKRLTDCFEIHISMFDGGIYVVIHETLEEIRLYSKNKDYKKNRKKLDESGHTNVHTPEYGEVIDISQSTLQKIREHFPDYQLPLYKWQVWN